MQPKSKREGRRGGGLGEEMKLAAIEGWLVLKQKSSRRHSEVAGSTLPNSAHTEPDDPDLKQPINLNIYFLNSIKLLTLLLMLGFLINHCHTFLYT